MKRKIFMLMIMSWITLFYSCNNSINKTDDKIGAENKFVQQEDGTISLKVDKAECYSDMINPSSNTAEWNVVVSKSGRFNVWLSSATKDTTNLQYKNSVMLNIHENRLEAHPGCDKIIHNSGDVTYPYFRADSFIGSLYLKDTGVYNIQVISEKIVPQDNKNDASSLAENSKLLSVFLTPIIR